MHARATAGGGATVPGTNDGDPLWTADDGGRARPRCALSIVGGVRRRIRIRGGRRRRRLPSRPSTVPTGEWARYFHGADGYRGTELLRATGSGGLSYLVIDRWESAAAYERFLAEHEEEYGRRNRAAGRLYRRCERMLGANGGENCERKSGQLRATQIA